ncbi:MAG: hypothetical protein CFH44_00288 [Proteobacteria bacterium]|nr:MAG: hypothetical protein CFH44_00288 [Pseudomonadota bacterium]|tara:strand:- start:429 stop:1049 length:621 start_codon:yes stop_codon:yes gene_type:complete
MKFNKGAMFGLDARIALAIFGALSVISGAALYSAIQETKATALLTELRETGKAWEQFYLDTGFKFIRKSISDIYIFDGQSLVENNNNLNNWKGPYLNLSLTACHTYMCIDHPIYKNIHLIIANNSNTWGDDITWNDTSHGLCLSGQSCSLWSTIGGIESNSLVKSIDIIVDGTDSPKSGNFKWYYVNDDGMHRIFLKIAPIDNPND